MPRPRTIDPQEVVTKMRDGTFAYAAEAARYFKCSRVRIQQILDEHAPDLRAGKVSSTLATPKERKAREAALRKETQAALKSTKSINEAAAALKLTRSGLYSRMRRLGIEYGRQPA
ncbi:hypothetical protein CcrColossus_gp234 [Caulobacter phage CcrColossus]|uniref:Uncharacterized protein n=1 Tax=Caulobacter phage CcrColossus TaxID=1211640 RepID=K4JRY3_9CAUD|nr:hypothetical protein CcrColossus_gp234 [Caulobacter phage CcrColossus]AFU88104.1 hypothetical protein CcrColossus_gp234 [Caulobacter phage CcrColossus]